MKDTKPEIVPENKKGFTVNASPLNPVKLELGAIVIIAVFLLVIVEYLFQSNAVQLGVLGSYGVLAMVWLIFRVRQTLKNLRKETHG